MKHYEKSGSSVQCSSLNYSPPANLFSQLTVSQPPPPASYSSSSVFQSQLVSSCQSFQPTDCVIGSSHGIKMSMDSIGTYLCWDTNDYIRKHVTGEGGGVMRANICTFKASNTVRPKISQKRKPLLDILHPDKRTEPNAELFGRLATPGAQILIFPNKEFNKFRKITPPDMMIAHSALLQNSRAVWMTSPRCGARLSSVALYGKPEAARISKYPKYQVVYIS